MTNETRHADRSSVRRMVLSGDIERISDAMLLSAIVGDPLVGGQLDGLLGPDGAYALPALSCDDLIALEGVGPAGAARLLAAVEVGRRMSCTRPDTRPVVSTPEDVVRVCGPRMWGMDREHFWTLALNTKNRLLKVIEVSVGSLNASIVHPRELFKEAVRISAASVIVLHNHPSGDPTPSGADIQLTRRIVKAGDVLGIEVLDHVVIGRRGEFASLRDLGLI